MEITARITADAEVKQTTGGKELTAFSVAMNDYVPRKEGKGQNVATFFSCAYWRSTAITPYLTKGAVVQLYGRLSPNAYIGADGNAKVSLNFHCNEIKIISSKTNGGSNKAQQAAVAAPAMSVVPSGAGTDDDLPF